MSSNVEILTWTAYAMERLRASNSPYRDYFHPGLELQLVPLKDDDAITRLEGRWPIQGTPRPVRIPADGSTNPRNNDGAVDYHPNLIGCFGTSWWNWRDGLTEACFFDFDYGHGGKALDESGIARVDQWAGKLPYVQNCSSKSGRGRHWLVRLKTPLPAKLRQDHNRNCRAIMQRLCADLGFDLRDYVCSFGSIQYLYSQYLYSSNTKREED